MQHKRTPGEIQGLCAALATALDQYPAEQATILRGFALALDGAVTLQSNGIHHVASASYPCQSYHTTLCACACRAVAQAPGGRCKHRYAVALLLRATQQPPTTVAQQLMDPEWLEGLALVTTTSLAAQICDPASRVRRELAGFSGPTPRHQ